MTNSEFFRGEALYKLNKTILWDWELTVYWWINLVCTGSSDFLTIFSELRGCFVLFCSYTVTIFTSMTLNCSQFHGQVRPFPHYSMKHLAEKRFQDLNLDFGSCSLEVTTWCPTMEMKEDFNSSNQMKPNREIIPPHHLANMVGDCYVWACM